MKVQGFKRDDTMETKKSIGRRHDDLPQYPTNQDSPTIPNKPPVSGCRHTTQKQRDIPKRRMLGRERWQKAEMWRSGGELKR